MAKIGKNRYCKFLTVYNKLHSLRDSFDGNSDICLSYGNASVRTQLDIALAALDCIYQEF